MRRQRAIGNTTGNPVICEFAWQAFQYQLTLLMKSPAPQTSLRVGKICRDISRWSSTKSNCPGLTLGILHVECDSAVAAVVRSLLLHAWPHSTHTQVTDVDELSRLLSTGEYDVVLAGIGYPGLHGLETLRTVRAVSPRTPVICILDADDTDLAIELTCEGAFDCVYRQRIERLLMAVPRACREAAEQERRLEIESDLWESESRFRAIFETLAEGVVQLNDDAVVIAANSSAAKMFRTGPEALVGTSAREWSAIREDGTQIPPEAFPGRSAVRTGLPQIGVTMGVRRPDGELIWITANAKPLFRGSDNKCCGAIMSFQDITEKRLHDAQVLKAQRLESLGLLAAGIAHDLNNVLAPILMGVPLLKARDKEPEDNKLLDTIQKSAERGAGMVRQILAFTKGSPDEQRLLQPQHIIRELQEFVGATFPERIRIEVEMSAKPWDIKGNATQLYQALLNLCVNARDAMPPHGGSLRISAINHVVAIRESLELRTIPPGQYVLIEVKDTGRGIPPEILAKIWEPFFSTKGPQGGTGLGLATVRGIVHNHHGHVGVESTLGQGSRFRIFIPAVPESAVKNGDENLGAIDGIPQGNGELILVVDDETHIREVVASLLMRQGYTVLSAMDGLQAYELLLQRGDGIRLLVTDLGMPELDGVGLAMLTRKYFPEIKILAVSGSEPTGGLAGDYRQHSDAFLAKPFTPSALFECVSKLLRAKNGEPISREIRGKE